MVKVDVVSVGVDKKINAYVALLQVRGGERTLPIFIGAFEAGAISVAIEQVRSPMPLVHDLLRTVVERLGGRVERVEILGMEADYYIACVEVVTREGRHVRVDARPSDAVALALRSRASIFIADEVVERSGVFLRKEGETRPLLHPEAGEREKKEASGGAGERGGGRETLPPFSHSGGVAMEGFSPSGGGEGRGEVDRLMARLRWLVREEAYEAAAEVRDRIGGGSQGRGKN